MLSQMSLAYLLPDSSIASFAWTWSVFVVLLASLLELLSFNLLHLRLVDLAPLRAFDHELSATINATRFLDTHTFLTVDSLDLFLTLS